MESNSHSVESLKGKRKRERETKALRKKIKLILFAIGFKFPAPLFPEKSLFIQVEIDSIELKEKKNYLRLKGK
jgi:hypothetical protein